jgi:hypothetical protein
VVLICLAGVTAGVRVIMEDCKEGVANDPRGSSDWAVALQSQQYMIVAPRGRSPLRGPTVFPVKFGRTTPAACCALLIFLK